jgi:hypothetical protein
MLALMMCCGPARAQTTKGGAAPGSNPLEPSQKEPPRIGLELGFLGASQSGEYTVGCGEFKKGARLNALIALAYDQRMAGPLYFEGLVGFQSRGLNSSYNSRENVLLSTNDGFVRTDVDFENLGKFNLGYFFVLPSAKVYFTKALYAGAGISANFLTGASTQYTKNILSKTVTINELGISEVFFPESESSDPYSKVYPEEKRTDVSGFALDGALYLGAELEVNKKIRLGPRMLFTIPFSSVVSNPDLKVSTFQILIGARYVLE